VFECGVCDGDGEDIECEDGSYVCDETDCETGGEPQTGWSFDQTPQQSFYMFEEITIDGLVVEGDGSVGGDGECYTSGNCDVIGAFRRGVCEEPAYQNSQLLCETLSVWNTDEEICIGWRYANSAGYTTVPLMGKAGSETDATFTYANVGESAYLKVYGASTGFTLELDIGSTTCNLEDPDYCTDSPEPESCTDPDATDDDGNNIYNPNGEECGPDPDYNPDGEGCGIPELFGELPGWEPDDTFAINGTSTANSPNNSGIPHPSPSGL
jgi:hypothetical protein